MERMNTNKRYSVRRGNAVLDMALVLPILLSVAFGTVEYGYYFFVKNTLQGASREGARRAIVSGATLPLVTTAVNNAMSAGGFPTNKYTVAVSPSTWATDPAGTDITVTVSATWSTIGIQPLPDAMGGINGAKTFNGRTVMRKE